MSEENKYNEAVSEIVVEEGPKIKLDENQVLGYLKRSEKNNAEILKSLKFIKRYYKWRAINKALQVSLFVLLIILGILGWGNITELFSNFSLNFQDQLGEVLKSGILEKINIS